MKTIDSVFTQIFRHFHPSLLMTVYMIATFIAIDASAARQSEPILVWAITRIYELTGVFIAPEIWKGGLLIGGFLIVYFRPSPLWTFTLSAPVIIYGYFAVWYGLATNSVPYATLAMSVCGYLAVLVLMVTSSLLATSENDGIARLRRISELEAENKELRNAANPPGA